MTFSKLLRSVGSCLLGACLTPLASAADAALPAAVAAMPTQTAAAAQEMHSQAARDLFVTVGKSLVVDSPVNIQRVSVGNGELAEALAVNPREVLVNGKAVGETSIIIWQQGGNRLFFDLTVRPSNTKVAAIQQQLDRELAGQDLRVSFENDTAFLRGTAKDLTSAERAAAIVSTLSGKTVNLLHVSVPPTEAQILLKVRFADVDRSYAQDLGINILSTGATNTIGRITTGQFSPPNLVTNPGSPTQVTYGDLLNVFLFRPDLNLATTIKALESKNVLQILAEPNVLAINGKTASFLAGGEFPYPTLQGGGGGLGAVTIQFREFGVRINFTPIITPRGTIRLEVAPEVSSLDFANGLVFQGFNIPALATRRVKTEIELESGQSFAIGGLLDNRTTEALSKVPGLGNIPLLGKLFQSRTIQKSNSELMVLVTPELVRPVPKGQNPPEVKFATPFLKGARTDPPRTPGIDVTGPVPAKPTQDTVPVEDLIQSQKALPSSQGQTQPQIQFVPMLTQPGQAPQPMTQPTTPAAPSAPTAAPHTGGGTGASQ
ncbi:MAG: pilus assembly protein N-terminal domain-containing protein [Acidobacteriia bacterium]|nr:pilus assembly protein N-terminal domain-containing protein [Terriglobia bacterium]